MVILIEKNTEMKLDIDRVIRIFFSLKYELLYRLGLDGISACFCSSTLNKSPSVSYRLPISCLKFMHYAYDNLYTVSIHCAPEMSEIDCIGRIESFWPKFVRGW